MLFRNDESSLRCYLAEFIGTFFLTFADCGVALNALAHPAINDLAKSMTPALTVMAIIFTLGELSGAHINPAVTVCFALRKVFPWRKVPGYIVSQIVGACTGALLLKLLYEGGGHLGMTEISVSPWRAAGWEAVFTFMLTFVILCTSHQHKIKGPFSAYPVAAIITVCGLIGKSLTGASMNPARSLGPALITGAWENQWVYIIGPLFGAMLATFVMKLFHHKRKLPETVAALGEKNFAGKFRKLT